MTTISPANITCYSTLLDCITRLGFYGATYGRCCDMTRLFLLPLLPALLWYFFLLYNQIPIKQGARVFYWIIGLGWGLAAFLSVMIVLTR